MFNQSLFFDNTLYSKEVRIASTSYIQTEFTAQTSLKQKEKKNTKAKKKKKLSFRLLKSSSNSAIQVTNLNKFHSRDQLKNFTMVQNPIKPDTKHSPNQTNLLRNWQS